MLTRILALLLLAPVSTAMAEDMPKIGPCRGRAIPLCRALDSDGYFPIDQSSSSSCSGAESPLMKAACYGIAGDNSSCGRFAKEYESGAERICDDMVEIGTSLRAGRFKPQTSCGATDTVAEKFCVALGTADYGKCPTDDAAEGCADLAKLLQGVKTDLENIEKLGTAIAQNRAEQQGVEQVDEVGGPTVKVAVELRSYYRLQGFQQVKLLVNGAQGATKDLSVNIPPGGSLNSQIVFISKVQLSRDAMSDWGFAANEWPFIISTEFGGDRVDCGPPNPSWRDIRVEVTWIGMTAGTVTGSPVTCKLVGG